jgi:hypothetical protein
VTLTLRRYELSNTNTTRRVNFYLKQAAGSPAGYEVRYNGSSVLYTEPATRSLSLSNPPSGTVYHDFGGGGSPDTKTLTFSVSIPPGLDLTASAPVVFDITYICAGSGNLNSVLTPTTLSQAITININVLSALQASYVGPALNFGEIGGVTTAQAPSHSVAGAIRVASSGPYSVAMTSANAYRMTYPGGDPAIPEQSIRYSARLAGQTRNTQSPDFATVVCARAGIAGHNLPLSTTLLDGGIGKTPATNYSDTLTITVTPLATPYVGAVQACPGL